MHFKAFANHCIANLDLQNLQFAKINNKEKEGKMHWNCGFSNSSIFTLVDVYFLQTCCLRIKKDIIAYGIKTWWFSQFFAMITILNKRFTYSDPGLGDSDLELLSWSASKMILLPVLRWLLELSEGNSGKLLDSNSGTYPKNEPPSSPKIKKGRKRPWEIRQKIQRGWKNTWKKLRNSHAFGSSR